MWLNPLEVALEAEVSAAARADAVVHAYPAFDISPSTKYI